MFKIISILSCVIIMASADMASIQKNTKKFQKNFLKKMSEKTISKMDKNTQEEYGEYIQSIKKLNDRKNYVIYFTSQSMDGSHQISLTKEIARINKNNNNNNNIKLAPITRGLDDNVLMYAKRLHDLFKNLSPLHQKEVREATETLKINPQLFKDFNVTEVPVFITATCGKKINKKSCDFYYKATGETSIRKIIELTQLQTYQLFQKVQK